MKVLNISSDDYANFAHDNAKALRAAGVNCTDVKRLHHPFGYTSESRIVGIQEMLELIRSHDIIQVFHSDLYLLEYIRYSGKRLIVYHTGTRYREDPEALNEAFNKYVDLSIIALCEFEGLGAKNEQYLVGAIDIDPNHRVKNVTDKRVIGHFPSNAGVKGTTKVLEMLKEVEAPFILLHSTDIVDHRRQLYRMQQSDIYVELFKPELSGKEYGSWGITALEAAALGCIVVTQNLHDKFYRKHYGDHPLILCATEDDFKTKVKGLLELSTIELSQIKRATRKWVLNNHSYKATGNRLRKILGI